jgi:hypothetical protein
MVGKLQNFVVLSIGILSVHFHVRSNAAEASGYRIPQFLKFQNGRHTTKFRCPLHLYRFATCLCPLKRRGGFWLSHSPFSEISHGSLFFNILDFRKIMDLKKTRKKNRFHAKFQKMGNAIARSIRGV